MCEEVLHDRGVEISVADIGEDMLQEVEQNTSTLDPDREVEVAAKLAVICGVCDESEVKAFSEWHTLGGAVFQRRQ